jgi:class 3 adenylate cyclase
MKAQGFPQSKLDVMDRQNTSILHMALNVEGVNRALQGETGVVVARSVAGEQSLQAFTPLSIPDLTWVLVARINESEILAPQNDFRRKVMIAASTLTLGSILLSMLLARFFLKPVNALLDGIRRLTSGSGAVTVAKTSNDEFGRLTDSFNQMAEQIRRRDEVISAKSTAYEQLLKRIFPDLVAERMRKGDAQVFDSVPNASVIYASVIGFVRLSESMPPDRALALINEIIDAFDTVAGAHGVEKVKTIGEHYVAACGLSTPRLDHAQRSINFADALSTALAEINARHGNRLSLRVGISSGPVQAGLIGSRKFVYDIWGRPLNHARRIVHDTDLGHVRITEDTYASLMSKDEMAELSRVPTKTFGELRTFGRRLKAELPTSEDMLADQATLKQAAE